MRTLVLSAFIALFLIPAVAQQPSSPAPAAPPRPPNPNRAVIDFGELARYRTANAALAPTEAGRVVFFGDSITDLWRRTDEKFFSDHPYVNRGISGQTTAQMLLRFRQDVIDLHPETVMILAGTNDIAGNTGPSTQQMIADNLISMAELARANHIRVVLASVLPAADYPWKKGVEPAPKIRALNEWIAQYCRQQHFMYLDYYAAMTDENGGMKPGISIDGVHPNAAGYAIMEPLAEAALAAKP